MICARALSRSFGDRRAIDRLDLDVAAGDFLLVTGANGAGKTTLLRLVAGLLVPTGGTLDVAVDRARVGFLGHEPLVYRELTPLENLDLYGRLYRVPERRERIGMLLERFGLWPVRNERAGSFSRDAVPRRRRGARAQGPAARAACARHRPGDAALRRRDARRLPLRAPV